MASIAWQTSVIGSYRWRSRPTQGIASVPSTDSPPIAHRAREIGGGYR